MLRHLLLPILVAGALAWAGSTDAQTGGVPDLELFTVGTGDVGGGYYSAGRAICEAVNRERTGQLRCSPEPTPGSLYNISELRDGQIEFALVQSDWQRAALEGTGRFAAIGPMPELRSVMSLYPETITVLARAGADIHAPGDIVGMRVDVGHPASGRHGTTMQMLDALGLDRGDFLALRELPSDIAVDELCAGRIDATILVLGHPNNGVARALASCGARLVAVEGPGIDTWLGGSPDFVPATIPGDAYRMLTTDVPTYAVMATLVTRSDVPDALVADLVGITLEDRANIAQSAPVLDKLDPDDMPVLGLTAPLHPGAAEAYGLPGQ